MGVGGVCWCVASSLDLRLHRQASAECQLKTLALAHAWGEHSCSKGQAATKYFVHFCGIATREKLVQRPRGGKLDCRLGWAAVRQA